VFCLPLLTFSYIAGFENVGKNVGNMKTLLYAGLLIAGCVCKVYSQDQNFLNFSVCADPEENIDEYINSYVQGAGHNYYISYTPQSHKGSFSEFRFPVGTDDNPLIVFVDSSDTENVKKYYYRANYNELYTGTDFGDAYISRGRWGDYSEEEDPLIGKDLPYEEAAFQCIINKEEEED
jgi:hypothetical protein